jgi:hypothetical protein
MDYFLKNQNLRILYLENKITEEELKINIQRNDKKTKKNTEIAQVLQLCNITFTDIVYRLMDNLTYEKHSLPVFEKEIQEIINYCNNILKDISFTYNCVQYSFLNTFVFKAL